MTQSSAQRDTNMENRTFFKKKKIRDTENRMRPVKKNED